MQPRLVVIYVAALCCLSEELMLLPKEDPYDYNLEPWGHHHNPQCTTDKRHLNIKQSFQSTSAHFFRVSANFNGGIMWRMPVTSPSVAQKEPVRWLIRALCTRLPTLRKNIKGHLQMKLAGRVEVNCDLLCCNCSVELHGCTWLRLVPFWRSWCQHCWPRKSHKINRGSGACVPTVNYRLGIDVLDDLKYIRISPNFTANIKSLEVISPLDGAI